MLKAITLFALFNNIEAQDFAPLNINNSTMVYRVLESGIEFQQVTPKLKPYKGGCQQFFKLAKPLKVYAPVTDLGYSIQCTDIKHLVKTEFKYSLMLTGLTADELMDLSNKETVLAAP